ncbi:hypothetical protein SAMN05216548_102434 [Faunimonas pinastri]|uniref:Ancillary SecYEG translocon subunit n=1 Tax=Faunimonas pinastri TaxID=1855383 RepID=A0A1H9DE23_9HYPH|nr:tetratricopeptide repeat protein [Faunimonas pinastri]SEQ11745.1 hypothetical protein SAMN05216548_102434 [Faunimonas pinastri]
MAEPDHRSQQFIREVHEEYRRDQLSAAWRRFGPILVLLCIAVIVVVAGYRGWTWWEARQAGQAGDQYYSALQDMQQGKTDEATKAFQSIAEHGGRGYAVLAKLQLAGMQAQSGKKKEAIAAYDAISSGGSTPDDLKQLARVRAGLVALDDSDFGAATSHVKDLAQAGNPWRNQAREILGVVAYSKGDLKGAREQFVSIQQEVDAPRDLQSRAAMMVALIDGQLPVEGQKPAAPVVPEGAAAIAAPAGDATAAGAMGGEPTVGQATPAPAAANPPDAAQGQAPVDAPAAPAMDQLAPSPQDATLPTDSSSGDSDADQNSSPAAGAAPSGSAQ